MSTFASQPSRPGTENSGSSAREAGPAAIAPAIASMIHRPVTKRLWARTKRVSEVMGSPSGRSSRNGGAPRRAAIAGAARLVDRQDAGEAERDDVVGARDDQRRRRALA